MQWAIEQIVGRERRERVSQLVWYGEGCFDSRRRVNSTVRHFRYEIPVAPLDAGSSTDRRSLCSFFRLRNLVALLDMGYFDWIQS